MPQRIPVRSTRTGGLDYLTVPTDRENWIAAYLRERDGYLQRGDAEGVAAVNAELRRIGATAEQMSIRSTRE